jgi:hypothetical protein
LAASQPANISTNVALVLAKAVTGADPLLPQSVTQLVSTAIAQIPNDTAQIQNMVSSGLSSFGCHMVMRRAWAFHVWDGRGARFQSFEG